VAGVRDHRRIAARYRAPRWLAHLVAAQVIPAASRCRRAAVASIISALRPGGWLLAEDPDFAALYASETDVVTRVVTQRCRYWKPSAAAWTAFTHAGSPPTWPPTTSSTSAPRTGSTKFKVAHPLRSDRLRFTVERSAIASSCAVTEVEPHDTFRLLQDPLSPPTAHERRILGTPGSLTLGNQADSAASSFRSAIPARKEQSAANWRRHTDRRLRARELGGADHRGLPLSARIPPGHGRGELP
jgi:hypothetical protein